MRFYLGTHQPQWLARSALPLFVSEARLRERKRLPRAHVPWALDSGGFSQLFLHANWPDGCERVYVEHVRRYADEIGHLEWAAPQDWMCEPVMLQRTGLTVEEHQRRTVRNVVQLRSIANDLPFVPVLQGWHRDDYLRCIDLYEQAGVSLTGRVGIGTVCRRQGTREAEHIVRSVHAALPAAHLHLFGAKITGLARYADAIASADSMAWSYHARRRPPLPGHSHKNCANCRAFAEDWFQHVLRMCEVVQPPLFAMASEHAPDCASGRQPEAMAS